MRLSIELPVAFPESIADFAVTIERAGFDAGFVTDHPYPPREWLATGGHLTLDPFVALATAAAATTTLRVHTHCLIPAYRNPYLNAKAVATLDAISRGRVILGVAAGYLEGEFEGLSVPFAQRGQLLDETLRTMQDAWADTSPNSLTPAPVQKPRPPVWVGGNTEIAMQRAATYDGWSPFPASPSMARRVRTADLADHDAVARAVARYRDLARADADVCFTPFSHPAYNDVVDPDTFVDEAHELARAGVTWLTFHLPAPSPAAFCDVVASFGAAVVSKVRM
jgi:probable F420-dependent oxidoreductase